MRMPPLSTARLVIRELTPDDLDAAYQLLDIDLADADTGTEGVLSREARRRWLEWCALNYEQLAYLHQPPYGDRAITLRATGELVGACGLVPSLGPFNQLPSIARGDPTATTEPGRFTPEVGLYWAVVPAHRRQGFATEAGQALIDYAFDTLHVARIVATTDHDNAGSIGVMRKLGMRIDRNPLVDPPWFQVVGVLEQGRRGQTW